MNSDIQKIKKRIEPILKRNDVEFAGVFGSYARGDYHEKSDIDFLVRFSKPKSLLMLVRFERDISHFLHRNVDVITEHSVSPYMKSNILKDLQTIYGKR